MRALILITNGNFLVLFNRLAAANDDHMALWALPLFKVVLLPHVVDELRMGFV